MKKYIIKNCPNCYCYGEHDYWCEFEHDNTLFTNPCQKSDCLLKQIVELLKVDIGTCDRCDGVGYFEGCEDTNCCFYRIMKIQELLDIEECENER